MSESEDSGPGRREVAHRLFAAEFDDAELSYSESDEERAPNYVVTPTGARVNRLFAVGVLTELEQVNDDVLRARIVDPTGAFVVYAGQYQPEALAFLESATPPLFVAVTGKARTFEPEDGDRVFTSVRPESISEVDAETRDRWIVQAAEQTVDRVARLASARRSAVAGDALQRALVEAGVAESDAAGAVLALEYYDTTGDYLQAVRELALEATRVVTGDRDEAGTLSLSPADGTDDPLAVLAAMELTEPETPATDEPTSEDERATDEPSTAAHDASDTAPDESPTTETDPVSTSEPIDETDTASEPSVETPEPTTESEQVTASDSADEGSSGTLADLDSGAEPDADSGAAGSDTAAADASDETDDVGDFDTEFELDDDEREEIEQEYGTDFQSGSEVDDAGEADIETPDPEELAEAEAVDPAAETEDAATGTAAPAGADAAAAESPGPDAADDVDLEDAVMAAMTERNDGTGADREAVISDVVSEYGADRAAVEEAIQDALMGGRCYEPDDGKLTPI